MTEDRILIIDFGSQVTQLIARRVRESGVYCEIWPYNQADDARIRAFCLTFDTPLHWQAVATWLEMLIVTRGESLLRVKGVLDIIGQDRPIAIHGVQHLFHPPAPLPAWPEGEARRSRLVFIVRDLDRSVIEDGLRAFQDASAQEQAIRAP